MNHIVWGLLGQLMPVKKYQFIVCSRNMTTNDKNNLYWKIAKKYNIEQILKENPTLTIQGEQGDTKVQGNKYGIKEPAMWVFNIIDHERNYHYDWKEMYDFCQKYKLKVVPIKDAHWDSISWKGRLFNQGYGRCFTLARCEKPQKYCRKSEYYSQRFR